MKKLILLVLLSSITSNCFSKFDKKKDDFIREQDQARQEALEQQLDGQIIQFLLRGTQLLNENNDLIDRLNSYLPEMDDAIFTTLNNDVIIHTAQIAPFITTLEDFIQENNDIADISFTNTQTEEATTLNQLLTNLKTTFQINLSKSVRKAQRRQTNRCTIL